MIARAKLANSSEERLKDVFCFTKKNAIQQLTLSPYLKYFHRCEK